VPREKEPPLRLELRSRRAHAVFRDPRRVEVAALLRGTKLAITSPFDRLPEEHLEKPNCIVDVCRRTVPAPHVGHEIGDPNRRDRIEVGIAKVPQQVVLDDVPLRPARALLVPRRDHVVEPLHELPERERSVDRPSALQFRPKRRPLRKRPVTAHVLNCSLAPQATAHTRNVPVEYRAFLARVV
jgi:hypothetical protein